MSWSYSPGLVAAFLEARCSDTEQSQPSSLTPTPDQFYWPDKPTEHSRISRFGMMCEPLTENLGAELLMWFQAGFPAKTSQSPEKVQDLTVSDQDCGGKWRGWLAKFDPDSCSWKTAQLSLLGDLAESSVILPRSGMTRGGLLWELPMLERRTSETGSGFFPTPVSIDAGSRRFNTSIGSSKPRPTLALMARKNLWPTPQASDNRNRGNADTPAIARRIAAGKQVMLTMTVSGGQLSPDWTEWLMGWPIGHTALKPSETGKCLNAEQQPGESLAGLELEAA